MPSFWMGVKISLFQKQVCWKVSIAVEVRKVRTRTHMLHRTVATFYDNVINRK